MTRVLDAVTAGGHRTLVEEVLWRWASKPQARAAGRPWTEDVRTPDGSTVITTKRCCNGCGAVLGDVQPRDIDRRGRLTDVRAECAYCHPPAGKAVEVYVPLVRFQDGQTTRYRVPAHSGDPRYAACHSHRVACDCREAGFAEDRNELRIEVDARRELEAQMRAVARLHRPSEVRKQCPECDVRCCATYLLAIGALRAIHGPWGTHLTDDDLLWSD